MEKICYVLCLRGLPQCRAVTQLMAQKVAKATGAGDWIPGWRSSLTPAFGPGRNPGDLGSNPVLGSRCMEPASPSAYVSASLSLSLSLSL
uniref:Uncharacterized protein n=1 Tax=Canis lupus familiaris TaxID=9615 RepID=A0A8C0M829_CANLF